MSFLRSVNLGFARDHQIILPLQTKQQTNTLLMQHFKNRLSNNKQVLSVGASSYYPGISNPSSDNFHKKGQDVKDGQLLSINHVDENYLENFE